MTFELLGFDFYWADRLFGFWIGEIVTENKHRHLLSVYYSDQDHNVSFINDKWIIDLLWFRILGRGY